MSERTRKRNKDRKHARSEGDAADAPEEECVYCRARRVCRV
jgi:hypothetical protein